MTASIENDQPVADVFYTDPDDVVVSPWPVTSMLTSLLLAGCFDLYSLKRRGAR
jgi:hypothetical protein